VDLELVCVFVLGSRGRAWFRCLCLFPVVVRDFRGCAWLAGLSFVCVVVLGFPGGSWIAWLCLACVLVLCSAWLCLVCVVVLGLHVRACFACLCFVCVVVFGLHVCACFAWWCVVCMVVLCSCGVTLLHPWSHLWWYLHLGTCLWVHGLWPLLLLCSFTVQAPLSCTQFLLHFGKRP
jgi:hypothetical protein